MGPLAILALTSLGSGLLNYAGGNAEAGRRDALRQQLMELLSPERLGSEAGSIFDIFRKSPMYTGLRTRAMESSALLGNQLQTSFARRGLGTSGIAGMALPIARASHIGKFQDIDTQLFMQALGQARESLGARASALTGTSGPSAMQLGVGNTLQSIMPLVLKYFESRQPVRGMV